MIRRGLFVFGLLAVWLVLGHHTASAWCGWAQPSPQYYIVASPYYYYAPACWSCQCDLCCSQVYYYAPCNDCCVSGWAQVTVAGSNSVVPGCSSCKPVFKVNSDVRLQPTPQPNGYR
jgi:hypothetical protein